MLSENFSIQQFTGDTVSRSPKANTRVSKGWQVCQALPPLCHWFSPLQYWLIWVPLKENQSPTQVLSCFRKSRRRPGVMGLWYNKKTEPQSRRLGLQFTMESALWDYLLPRFPGWWPSKPWRPLVRPAAENELSDSSSHWPLKTVILSLGGNTCINSL